MHTFKVNGRQVTVYTEDNVRLLWVLRDLLGTRGLRSTAEGSTSARRAPATSTAGRSTPCSVPVSRVGPNDEITTSEGLPATVGSDLHPMQQAWLERDVPQCGYCQPGQIMAAVDKVKKVRAEGREITEDDLNEIRNVCRCGTYHRIREAILAGAENM